MRTVLPRWAGAVVAVVAVVLAAAATVAAGAGAARAESNGGVRVMPLGDSITDGLTVPGGYRIGLWQRFVNAGYRVDFVGSLSNGPASLGDHDHEGHSGWRIDQIDANIVNWLHTFTPHTVLLHIGTNDVIQNDDLANAPARLSALIDHITATAPDAEVFVATIIPLASASAEAAVRTYNAAIPGIVQSKASAGRHVHLVDMHSALTAADLADGVHPNATGYDKMAATWYNALLTVPGSIGTPGGTNPPPPGGGCTATYSVANQWTGGFQGSVTVTAGSSAITGWTVTWQFANGQTVTQSWSATVTSTGATVTARNVGYNGALAPAASTQFGFIATWTTANETPTPTCTAT
ncbi:MAG: cellulose binding domain-containing protein [Mycobacteriales bacterium]